MISQMKHKKKIIALLCVFVLLPAIYTGAWFFMAKIINQKVVQFYNGDAPAMGITFIRSTPVVAGFPGPPKIMYRSGIQTEGFGLSFKKIYIRGFPIPGMPMNIKVEKGPNIYIWRENHTYNLDDLNITFRMPMSFPKSTFRYHMQEWQEKVGTIKILNLESHSDNITLSGEGYIGFDENLQPLLMLDGTLSGYDSLIRFLVAEKVVTPLQGAIAQKAFDGLAPTPAEGEIPSIPVIYTIKDNQFRAGPLYIGQVPYLKWRQGETSPSSG